MVSSTCTPSASFAPSESTRRNSTRPEDSFQIGKCQPIETPSESMPGFSNATHVQIDNIKRLVESLDPLPRKRTKVIFLPSLPLLSYSCCRLHVPIVPVMAYVRVCDSFFSCRTKETVGIAGIHPLAMLYNSVAGIHRSSDRTRRLSLVRVSSEETFGQHRSEFEITLARAVRDEQAPQTTRVSYQYSKIISKRNWLRTIRV